MGVVGGPPGAVEVFTEEPREGGAAVDETGKFAVSRELGGRNWPSLLAIGLQEFSRRGLNWARALLA